MKKYFIILAGILLLAAGCQKQPGQNEVLAGITVISPISGQKLEIDSEYEIAWVRNNSSGGLLNIDLVSTDGANRMYKITYAAPKENKRQGKLKWKISGIEPGKYKIHIYASVSCTQSDPSCKLNEGYSGEIVVGNQDTQNLPQGNKTGWETFSNSQYGFTIQYPKEFKLYSNWDDVKSLTYSPVCSPNMTGCLVLLSDSYPKTNFEGAGISIDVHKDLGTKASCLAAKEGEKQAGKQTINGAEFQIFEYSGVGAGHVEDHRFYRTFNKSECIVVALRVAYANIGVYEPGAIKEFNEKEVWNKLEQTLSTFKFLSSDQTIVKVFFAPNGSSQDQCNDVVAINRIVTNTPKIATAVLEELLKGPTSEEKKLGYLTNIPAGSKLNSLSIINGEARADFNEKTQSGGGSCSMGIRTAQITNTLLQFSTIKKVIISIDGKTENIFQP